jgi:hypothetical protein
LKTPGETDVLVKSWSEPSACGTRADGRKFAGTGVCTGPVGVQSASTQLTVTVPVGVTVHDCVAVPPDEVVAMASKPFDARDSAAVGVQLIVLPASVEPAGSVTSEKVTVPPAGSVAANV